MPANKLLQLKLAVVIIIFGESEHRLPMLSVGGDVTPFANGRYS